MVDAPFRSSELLVVPPVVSEGEATVVWQDGRIVDFRPLKNVFRRQSLAAVRMVVNTVLQSGDTFVSDADGLAASPVFAADGGICALRIGSVADHAEGCDDDRIGHGGFEWELPSDLPPRLRLAKSAPTILGIGPESQDRSIYGPTDFFGCFARIADVVARWEAVITAGPGYRAAGTVRLQDGSRLHFAEQWIDTDLGPRIRGVVWNTAGSVIGSEGKWDVLDAAATQLIIREIGASGAVVDTRFPGIAVVLRWLTPHTPGLGNGASTGQTPGLHPEDAARLPELVAAGGPVHDTLRARKLGGGWMALSFYADLLDRDGAPTIALAMITDSAVSSDSP